MLYATNRCNSRCNHCRIWAKKPKQDLSKELICKILDSRSVTRNTIIGLEGGEFLLHPEAHEILDMLSRKKVKFDLLTNCLSVSNLGKVLKKFSPNHLYFSLDGNRNTYKQVRGVDGYDNVIQAIEMFRHIAPVSVMFTLTSLNDFEDLIYVSRICKFYEVDMRIGIYNEMEYFESALRKEGVLNYKTSELPQVADSFPENYDFLALWPEFRDGNLKLPCFSIYDSLVIYPNGDVPLCQHKGLILGNLNFQSLDEIINNENSKLLRKQMKNCNECWINFHRKYDIALLRNMERFLPRWVIEKITGKYYWNKPS